MPNPTSPVEEGTSLSLLVTVLEETKNLPPEQRQAAALGQLKAMRWRLRNAPLGEGQDEVDLSIKLLEAGATPEEVAQELSASGA